MSAVRSGSTSKRMLFHFGQRQVHRAGNVLDRICLAREHVDQQQRGIAEAAPNLVARNFADLCRGGGAGAFRRDDIHTRSRIRRGAMTVTPEPFFRFAIFSLPR